MLQPTPNPTRGDNSYHVVTSSGTASSGATAAGSSPDVRSTLVQGGYPGAGNLEADPLFVDPDGADNIPGTPDDDLRLQRGSPAIDAGNNAFIPADLLDDDGDGNTTEPAPFDRDGQLRLAGAAVDMGAYERQNPRSVYLPLIGR